VQNQVAYRNTLDAFRQILFKEGVKGLFKGVTVQLLGVLPAQVAYLSTLEVSKATAQSYGMSSLVSHMISGGLASLVSTTIAVPVDVVSQRQMIQGSGYHLARYHYNNALDAFRSIWSTEGIKGLYRGCGASIITNSTSSAIWWSGYSTYKQYIHSHIPSHPIIDFFVVALSGVLASITAVSCTQPLDVAKTRLQVQECKPGLPKNIFSMMYLLYKEEGALSLWCKGLEARMITSSCSAVMLISSYEIMKRFAVKNRI